MRTLEIEVGESILLCFMMFYARLNRFEVERAQYEKAPRLIARLLADVELLCAALEFRSKNHRFLQNCHAELGDVNWIVAFSDSRS